jgi:hypothetical protein
MTPSCFGLGRPPTYKKDYVKSAWGKVWTSMDYAADNVSKWCCEREIQEVSPFSNSLEFPNASEGQAALSGQPEAGGTRIR